jgi:hypothetical protein
MNLLNILVGALGNIYRPRKKIIMENISGCNYKFAKGESKGALCNGIIMAIYNGNPRCKKHLPSRLVSQHRGRGLGGLKNRCRKLRDRGVLEEERGDLREIIEILIGLI